MSTDGLCNRDRLRVLVFAYDVSPAQGSECGSAWNLVSRLAQYHDITVVCADGSQTVLNSYKVAIERWLLDNGEIEHLRFIYVEHPAVSRRLSVLNRWLSGMEDGVGNRFLFFLALRSWQRSARYIALSLSLEGFDIVHHLTPVGFWGVIKPPSESLPFCWGPVGGLASVPLRMSAAAGIRQLVADISRLVFSWTMLRTSPWVRGAPRETLHKFCVPSLIG